jgi:hydrogenase expression/formation protein HypE
MREIMSEMHAEYFGTCPLPVFGHETIQLSHGSGGKLMNDLISGLFIHAFDNPILNRMEDAASLPIHGQNLVMSTDSYTVDPIFFPGGNIGDLAVNGTVNDICMRGARPLFLSVAMILEEGLAIADLQKIVASMRQAAAKAEIKIVTGDTKVVNKGKCDRLFINTTGIGVIDHDCHVSACNLQPGDKIIISGSIGDHGIAILSQREGFAFAAPIASDTVSLHNLIAMLMEKAGPAVHSMRDPTRGGLASVLNELAQASAVEMRIYEKEIPIRPAVQGACELLGLDPLYVANEGKCVIIAAADRAQEGLELAKKHELGREAAIIGEVLEGKAGRVTLKTKINSWRIIDMPVGELLPRIC